MTTADGHHHVHPEGECNQGHEDQREKPAVAVRAHEDGAQPDADQRQAQVQPVAGRQGQRLAGDACTQLAECDNRAGEGDCADQHPEVDLHLVDGLQHLGVRAFEMGIRVQVAGEAHQNGGQTHEAVQDGDQLRHLGHLHP